MSKKGMMTGLLAVGIPLVGAWIINRVERARNTRRGTFAGYSFTIKKDE